MEPSRKEGAKREPSPSIWQTDEGQAGFPAGRLCWVNQGRRKAVTESVGKWFLLHQISKDSKDTTLCCCDRFLFCLVSYKRSRWNFLLFSEIIIIHSEDKIFEAFFLSYFSLAKLIIHRHSLGEQSCLSASQGGQCDALSLETKRAEEES